MSQFLLDFARPDPLPSYVVYAVRQRLRALMPSAYWVDLGSEWYRLGVRDGSIPPPASARPHVERLLYKHQVFPPGGKHTGMVFCASCRHWVPPMCMEGAVCDDCRDDVGEIEDGQDRPAWDYRQRHDAIGAMARGDGRPIDVPLPSESEAALRKEIQGYRESGWYGKVDWYQRDGRWGASDRRRELERPRRAE